MPMAPRVPWGLPTQLRAGDTWLWRFSLTDYPVSEGWVPSYALRGQDAPQWQSGWVTDDGNEWTFQIPADITAPLCAGPYAWTLTVTGAGAYAGRVHSVCGGTIDVLANLTIAEDGRTFEDQLIAKLEAAILALTTGNVQSYTIGNRQVTYRDVRNLQAELGAAKARRYQKRFGRIDIPILAVLR